MAAMRKNALNRMLRKGMNVKKTAISGLKILSTAMKPYDSCTQLKYEKLYNALS
jgi:hypothetical protein